jgi:hypothetical protein
LTDTNKNIKKKQIETKEKDALYEKVEIKKNVETSFDMETKYYVKKGNIYKGVTIFIKKEQNKCFYKYNK